MLISFGVTFAWAFIEPQFMFYGYEKLSWSSSQLGLVISSFGLACTLGEFSLGRLSDHLGRKPVLVLGLALFSAQFIGLLIFRDTTWIVATFLLAGLGNSLFDPALSAHLLDITPPEHTARIMGLRSTVGSLGSMLGPALPVLFTPFVTPQLIFLIAAGLVFMLPFTSALVLRSPHLPEAAPYGTQAVAVPQGRENSLKEYDTAIFKWILATSPKAWCWTRIRDVHKPDTGRLPLLALAEGSILVCMGYWAHLPQLSYSDGKLSEIGPYFHRHFLTYLLSGLAEDKEPLP